MEARKFIHVEVTDVCSLKLIFLDCQTALHTSSIPFHDWFDFLERLLDILMVIFIYTCQCFLNLLYI